MINMKFFYLYLPVIFRLSILLMLTQLFFYSDVLAFDEYQVVGWHWYNEPQTKKENKQNKKSYLMMQFNALPASEQLRLLQKVTDNLRDKAILSGKVSDITAYKKAQDFWVEKATLFTVGWERMLLENPDLNYGLTHSHENAFAPIMQREEETRKEAAVKSIAKQEGLLFFYRGNNAGDLFFSNVIKRYTDRYQLSLIPVSVDGETSAAFKNKSFRDGMQKANALNIRYFPALVLVNVKTDQHEVVSYGFKSEDEISNRLLEIQDNWKPNF